MRHIFSLRSVLGFCALTVLYFSTVFSSFGNLTGNWVHHGGAALTSDYKESRVYKIIDGNCFVYMLVRGVSFNKDAGNLYSSRNDIDPIQLFCYDKSAEMKTENLKFLPNVFETSGSAVKLADYDPKAGVLAVVYEDNKIDFITDDGDVVYASALTGGNISALPTIINSVTFDTEKPVCYIACSFGYAAIDYTSGNLEKIVTTNHGVAWAGRVGDRMVLFAGDKIDRAEYSTLAYSVDPEEKAITLEGNEIKIQNKLPGAKLNEDLTLPNPQALMPLDGNRFAAIAQYTADTNHCILLVDLNDDTATEIVSNGTFDNASDYRYRHLFRTDGRYWLTTDGYGISDSKNIYLIDFDGQLQTIAKTGLTAVEQAAKTSTVDGKRFWLHTYDTSPEQGMYYRDCSAGNWEVASAVIPPYGASSSLPAFIKYHPEYGMIFRGPSAYMSTDGDIDMMTSYKDGKWTNRSLPLSNTALSWKRINYDRYIEPDPVNPDWIWNSSFIGLNRRDFENPDNLFIISNVNHASNSNTYPGFFGIMQNPDYNLISITSNVSFDNNGTMWWSFDKVNGSYDTDKMRDDFFDKVYIPLYYYTAEERASMTNPGADRGQFIEPHEIKIKGAQSDRYNRLIAMKSKGNENYIAHTTGFYVSDINRCFIFDHNGTPEDTSDDRLVVLKDMVDEDGQNITAYLENNIYEDVEKGNLWLFTLNGPYIINPSDALAGSKVMHRPHITRRDGMTVDENPLDQIDIKDAADDKWGRKWFASASGVFCLSKDSEELLAHFTADNSPLPSNMVIGIGCDMESGAVFFGTEKGIVEFQPEGMATTIVSTQLNIWPQIVEPDYQGYVNCSGAIDGQNYAVYDREGNKVMDLGKPSGGMFQIHPTADSTRLEPGKYTIRRTNVSEDLGSFILM